MVIRLILFLFNSQLGLKKRIIEQFRSKLELDMKVFLLLFSIVLLTSCHRLENYVQTFEIRNITDHHVSLEYFKYGRSKENVEIGYGGESVLFEIGTFEGKPLGIAEGIRTDSMRIIFDSAMVTYHVFNPGRGYWSPHSGNILDDRSYAEDPEHYYTYLIREQEYERAVLLEE